MLQGTNAVLLEYHFVFTKTVPSHNFIARRNLKSMCSMELWKYVEKHILFSVSEFNSL